jgi:acetoin utilization deacetylase AcuC-like enzyme
MEKLGVLYDPVFLRHETGPAHPESPMRLRAVKQALDEIDWPTEQIEARPAMREELLMIHTPEYVDFILGLDVKGIVQLDLDTAVSEHSKEAALKAAGGTIEAVKRVIDGKFRRAFCAVRPPGHHAERDRAMGFCIFNNVAIGAAYALKAGLERIAIIDWDLHHGNGTQNSFYDTDQVLYISLHQAPFYPGTGTEQEKGIGKGLGYNINIPMVAGSSDVDFRGAFDGIIMPSLRNYEPQLIMISAGFDSHRDDPLGSLYLTTEYFGEMTRALKNIADECSNGRIVSVLEGGYNFAALKECVAIHLKELCA